MHWSGFELEISRTSLSDVQVEIVALGWVGVD